MGRRATAEEEMDPAIWGRLPEDLLEHILSLLPLRTVLSLRPTCKRFHSLLLSPSFLSLLPSSSSSSFPPSSFLLLSHPQLSSRHLPFYDFSSSSWRTVTLPSPSLALCSSSSGLLCFLSCCRFPSLIVSNLFTRSSRTLYPPVKHFAAASLVPLAPSSAASTHGYKLLVPSHEGVFVYDSGENSWTRSDALDHALLSDQLGSQQDGALFRGSLYYARPEPFQVVGFDIQAGRWTELAARFPAENMAFQSVVSSGNRLFLVGGVGTDGIARSLRIWELVGGDQEDGDGAVRRWREVGRLPEMMGKKFWSACYHNYAHLQCFCHGGLVCVGCTTWPEVLLCRVERGTWHWLPRCPMLPEMWSCGFRWFSFVADLRALV